MTATVDMPTEQNQNQQRGGSLVRIVDTPDNIEKSWGDFQDLKKKIIKSEDLQAYTVGSGNNKQTKHFIKKSGWKKIGAAFGVDVQVQNCETIPFEPGYFAIKYTVRAIAPSGRYADGVGSCDSHEERFEETIWQKNSEGKSFKQGTGVYKFKYNDIDGTAYTRAANRAIADLVGGGEVSAEEMSGIKDITPAVPELGQRLQDRLIQLASDRGEEGKALLAQLVFAEIGSRFLTVEQATRIAEHLKAGPSTKAGSKGKEQEVANKPPVVAKAEEIFEAEAKEIPLEDQEF